MRTENLSFLRQNYINELLHHTDMNLTDQEEVSWSVYKGVGKASGINREISAVKLALQDSLMITALKKYENIMVQIMGDISLLEFNHVIDYIQDIAGKSVTFFGGCDDYSKNMPEEVCVIITVYN